MNTGPAGIRLRLVFVLWLAALVSAWLQTTGPVPARDWRFSDLLTLRGWVEPVGLNTARGRTVIAKADHLRSVHFVNEKMGWAVGDGGTILVTQDAGRIWQPQSSGTSALLTSVTFSSKTQGWAVGEKGTILSTVDGGQTWKQQSSGTTATLTSVTITLDNQGWVVGGGGTVLFTKNGGQTWEPQSSGATVQLNSVTFTSNSQGWAVGGGGTILRTQNGGQTWEPQSSGTTVQLNSVTFTSNSQGWVVGFDGTILTTQDGGQTWQPQNSGVTSSLHSVIFTSATQGWAVGWAGTILSTQDGGQTWQSHHSGTFHWLLAVTFTSTAQGWIVGSGGTILTMQDGGQTWQPQIKGSTDFFRDATFKSGTQGWLLIENSGIWSTQDGGRTWHQPSTVNYDGAFAVNLSHTITSSDGGRTWLPTNVDNFDLPNSITFPSTVHGWMVGAGGVIAATQNGGRSWQLQSSNTTNRLNDVTFISITRGWSVGDEGTIVTTENGGESWKAQSSGTNTSLRAVTFTSEAKGWAVGSSGTIVTTENGGKSWQAQSSGTSTTLEAVTFISETQGWAVGNSNTFLHTQNGGQTWQAQSSGTNASLRDVTFISETQGWAVGDVGTILRTQNGGQSWQAQSSGTNASLRDVTFISETQGWAVGFGGTILHTQNGGQTWENISPKPEFWRDMAFGETPYRLWPSPLAMAVCALLLLGLLSSFSQHLRHVRSRTNAGGIHDAPIEDLHSDRLHRAPLVRSLAQLFRNQDTRPPLAVALYAPWGVGKSSVLGMLKTELQGHARCVYINPWHYPQDSQLLAALMTGICKEAVPPMLSWANVVFRFHLLRQRVLVPHWRWLLAVGAVGAVFFLAIWDSSPLRGFALDAVGRSAFAHVVPSVQQTWLNVLGVLPATLQAWAGEGVKGLLALLLLLLIGRKALQRLCTFSPSLTRALAQSAQWAAKSMSLPDWSQHAGLRYQFAQDFREIAQAFGRERLVLLIDDLDRCEPNQVAQILATLNFVFTNQAPCFVVLAMDKNYVEHALGLAYNDMALALRDGQADARDASQPQITDNKARLDFARQYVRKLVQLELHLSHHADQGALMVLDTLSEAGHANPVGGSNTPTEPKASWWDWVQARWRYHLRHRPLSWRLMRVAGRWNYRRIKRLPSAALRLIGQGITHGFNAVLDARGHRWQSIGNTLVVAGSYVAALVVTAVVTVALPILVPKTVPDTTAQAATSQKAKGANTPSAEKAAPEIKPAAETQKPEREGSGGMVVLQPDTNPAEPWWLSSNVLALFIFAAVIVIRAQQTVRDSEGFLLAKWHWREVFNPRFPNLREEKRLDNMLRFLTMRVRSDQYQSRSERLCVWWRDQLRWAHAVLDAPEGTALPRPDELKEPETFRLSEWAAVELWMLDYSTKRRLRELLPELLKYKAEDESNRVTALDLAKDLDSFEHFISSCYSNPGKGKAPKTRVAQSAFGDRLQQIERVLETSPDKFRDSPNLFKLFQQWRGADKGEAIAALQKWLSWTHDLRMDLSEEDKTA